MVTTVDLEIYKRDTKTYSLVFTDSDGVAINITGYTIWMTVKESATDTDANAKIQKTVTSHDNAAGGLSSITLSASDTDIDVGTYYYDMQYKDGSGNITTFISGTLTIVQDITISTS